METFLIFEELKFFLHQIKKLGKKIFLNLKRDQF